MLALLTLVSVLFCGSMLLLAIRGSLFGRAPSDLTYDGSPVTSVAGVWMAFAYVLVNVSLLLWRSQWGWLTLVALLTIQLLVRFDAD